MKTPSPSRLVKFSVTKGKNESFGINVDTALESVWVLNTLDSTEDYLAPEKIMIGSLML